MRLLRWCWAVPAVLLWAGAAGALDGPSVKIAYSLDKADGGRFDFRVTETPLGLGDVSFVMTEEDDVGGVGGDESTEADAMDANPVEVVIEYTADPATHDVIDGPVELSDLQFRTYMDVYPAGLSTTMRSDIYYAITGAMQGTLAGDTITWDTEVLVRTSQSGLTDCLGDEILCTVGAMDDPWPRIEDPGSRRATCTGWDYPDFTIFADSRFGDRVISDNGTPASWTDDICAYSDPQVRTLYTWEGVEMARVFVPEPSGPLLRVVGLLTVVALRRRAWRRERLRYV